MTDSRVRIYDRNGNFVDEILTRVARTWEKNKWGEASFNFPYKDPKWKESTFQFGNLVYITTGGLPAWGGIIDNKRDWGQHEAGINAYSGEYLFNLRCLTTPMDHNSEEWGIYTATPGEIFIELINQANAMEPTGIIPYSIFGGGQVIEFNGIYDRISNKVTDLVEQTYNDYDVTPFLDTDGRLKFHGNWYKRRAIRRNTVLREGYNIQVNNNNLYEYPPKSNYIIVYGNTATTEDMNFGKSQDIVSCAKSRLRMECIKGQTNEQADLDTAAANALRTNKKKVLFSVTALNKGNLFNDLGIGNVLKIKFVTYGFGMSTEAEIIRMSFTDNADEVDLTLEEYTE